jgi:hypothetical protein
VELGPINDLAMIWLPKRAQSKERIRSSICQHWPAELRAKLSLVEGFDAKDFVGNISQLVRSPLVHDLLGDAMQTQALIAEEIYSRMPGIVRPVAVTLGHVAAWRKVAKGPDDGWTIVLEDDAGLDGSARTLNDLEMITVTRDLSKPSLVMLDPRQELDPSNGKCKSCRGGCGSNAYAIDKKAALHLLQSLHQNLHIAVTIDALLNDAITSMCPLMKTPFTHPTPFTASNHIGIALPELATVNLQSDADAAASSHITTSLAESGTVTMKSDVDLKVCQAA